MSVGVPGLVDEAGCSREETVLVACLYPGWEGSVREEVCDPPAGGVRHIQLGELVLQQSRDDGVRLCVRVSVCISLQHVCLKSIAFCLLIFRRRLKHSRVRHMRSQ